MKASLRLTSISEELSQQEVSASYMKCMAIFESINDFFEDGVQYRYQLSIYDEMGNIISRKNLAATAEVSLAMCA